MDNKKDTKEIENRASVEVFLGQDNLSVFLFKKTERLVGALFMLARILPEKDPLSETVKKLGLHLMSYISRAAASQAGWTSAVRQEVKETTIEIVSVLGVAHVAGFISTMNYNVIVAELNNLLLLIAKENNFGGISLPKNLFDVGILAPASSVSAERKETQADSFKGHIRHVSFKKEQSLMQIKVESKEKRQDRKNVITDVFKKQGRPLTIKDLTLYVKDCSEKTIQRELVSMVLEGVLKKEGERRWSRYSLN